MLLRMREAVSYRLSAFGSNIWLADSRKLTADSHQGGAMIRRIYFAVAALVLLAAVATADRAQAQQAYGRAWGSTYNTLDWDRFYHYPYVYYPQNFWGNEYYRSADSLYYRYPPEMRIPVYNRHWFNDYPTPRPYHRGHHFVLDIF